ncbi:hypothetical protein G5714_009969 [Onychostoma macrolepis]|uniref:Uncharacterized protein n=1 Tax=Onychostoma macrolepis TaxID=369639 RepID=A0A7J6CNV9_9TELE|nr:hypothetical protein G5714_009969 [Onychostoma macrolepis]
MEPGSTKYVKFHIQSRNESGNNIGVLRKRNSGLQDLVETIQNTNMTIVLAARNRQGGVVNTHSRASRLSQWLVFGTECSFPPPRDSIRNAALIPEPVACRLCQGGVSGPSSPGGALATAVLVSLPAHDRAEQQ